MSQITRKLKDALLLQVYALPNAGGGTEASAVIDLGGVGERRPENFELVAEVPALVVGILPDDETATTEIEMSDAVDFSSGVATLGTVVQTGAGGTGAAAVELRVRVPANGSRYVRAKTTLSASAEDASAVEGEFSARF